MTNYDEPLTWLENMENMIIWLSGKKVYLLAVAALAYAIGGYFTGHFDQKTALDMIWAALTAMAMRAGVAKSSPK